MLTKKEKDLMSVLEYAGVASLPRLWVSGRSNRIWVSAILEVRKVDGSESYAFADNVYGREPHYRKVWGNMAAISSIVGIHPTQYLEKDYIPQFKTIEDLRKLMAIAYDVPEEVIAKYSDEDVKNLAYNNALSRQRMFMAQEGEEKYRNKQRIENAKIYREITGSK